MGLLFIELYTGRNPYYPLEFNWLLEFFEKIKNRELHPNIPSPVHHFCPPLIVSTIKQMIIFDPSERPTAAQVLRTLNDKKTERQLKKLLKLVTEEAGQIINSDNTLSINSDSSSFNSGDFKVEFDLNENAEIERELYEQQVEQDLDINSKKEANDK